MLALAAAAISGAASANCLNARESINRLPETVECPKVAEASEDQKRTLAAEGGLLLDVPDDIELRINTPASSANEAAKKKTAA
ncbi:MAG: hypothetical protein Hals2KO_32790 [Halioglobus sp.]